MQDEKQVVASLKADFYFTLGKDGNRTVFRFNSLKGGPAVPDYRRFTGTERELLREFCARCDEQDQVHSVNLEKTGDANTLFDPGDRLPGLAISAGLLRDSNGTVLLEQDGLYRCALDIHDVDDPADTDSDTDKPAEKKAATLSVSLTLVDDDDALVPLKPKEFYTLSRRLGVYQNKIYHLEDLGMRWAETDWLFTELSRRDLCAFLSLVFSGFTGLEIRYENWSVKHVRPAHAVPGLLFMEIDAFGYLHVRPISLLRDLPPLFLENGEIVTVVTMDEKTGTFGIAEVIFPPPPAEDFRNMLYRGNRGTAKTQVAEENDRFIIAPEFAAAFLGKSIMELSERFVLLETQVLGAYQLHFSKPMLRVSMGGGIDYLGGETDVENPDEIDLAHGPAGLTGEAVVEFAGETFTFAGFMDEYHNNSYITLADGSHSFPDERTMQRFDRLVSRLKGDEAVEFSWYDVPLIMQDESIEISGAAWEAARAFFTGYNTIAERKGDWSLTKGRLRHYQEYGVRWLDYLREHRMGACLADEMGLGKTIQVIALLRALYKDSKRGHGPEGTVLILCPKSLVFNWAAELDRFAPELPYTVHYGTGRARRASDRTDFRILLSTYATLRMDVEEFRKIDFLYIILDESQNIKNSSTQVSAAVLSLRGAHRLAISGTPVENNLLDLYSLFRFLNPRIFGSEKLFVQQYLKPIQDNADESVMGDLRARIYPFMLRRLKRDVLKELPDKMEEIAYIELEPDHLEIYHRRRLGYKKAIEELIKNKNYDKSSMVIFKILGELRRLASVPESEGEYLGPSAKRQYIREMIAGLAASGHKCLIFTNFLAQVDLVSRDLTGLGIANLVMTGATVDRQGLVRRFQTDPEVKAFIMTLKTGGAGLNLTAADYIFILDPWWNSAAEAQAVDRSHRIGQANPVFCFRLIARDTIEERIMELQKRKSDLVGALLSDDAGSLKTLDPDEVAYLVGGSDE
ncbi:helicase SNF [Spirochaetia bacterium]|nr:helicase SNF [Spirochaetia bacterium]